jgi:hypothetical protein
MIYWIEKKDGIGGKERDRKKEEIERLIAIKIQSELWTIKELWWRLKFHICVISGYCATLHWPCPETPRRRITVTSSLIEVSTNQLENGVVVRGGQTFGQIFKDDVNGFSSTSDISFMQLMMAVSRQWTIITITAVPSSYLAAERYILYESWDRMALTGQKWVTQAHKNRSASDTVKYQKWRHKVLGQDSK